MAFDVIGGIGAGLMQGSQFVANQRQQRENNKYRDAMMGMQEERHGWQRQQFEQQQAEQERINTLNTLQTRIEDQYKDRPDFERQQMYFDSALGMGLIKPDELGTAREAYEGLIQNFGIQAIDEFYLTGKVDGLNRIAGQRMPGTRIEVGERGRLRVVDPSGAVNELDAMGIKQLLSLNKAIERQSQRDQAGLAAEEKRASIGAKRALAFQRMNPASGGGSGGTSSRTGEGRPFDVISSQRDYNAALPSDQTDFDAIAGHRYFHQIADNNPDLMKTPSGQSNAVAASIALARGAADVRPVIGEDGRMMLVAKIGPNEFVLESGVSDQRIIELMQQYQPDTEEKPGFIASIFKSTPNPPPGVDEAFVAQMYLDALRTKAVRSPEEFASAWRVANDEETFKAAAADARESGDPRLIKMISLAEMIRRGMETARESALSDRPATAENATSSEAREPGSRQISFTGKPDWMVRQMLRGPAVTEEVRAQVQAELDRRDEERRSRTSQWQSEQDEFRRAFGRD